MEEQKIFEELKTIISSINSSAAIDKNTALLGDSVLDSLEFMNYLTKVEEAFGIVISDTDISGKSLGIVGNLINYIVSYNQIK